LTERWTSYPSTDHGELAGAHGLSGKGATCYREQNNLPVIIAHPDYQGGKRCNAVTSHVDISTTLPSIAKGESPWVEGLPGAALFAVSTMDGTSLTDIIPLKNTTPQERLNNCLPITMLNCSTLKM
jgi:arylsulfatase A-like enzyme